MSLEIGGRRLGRLRARPGQFFIWRFLTRGPGGRRIRSRCRRRPTAARLRITVKGAGRPHALAARRGARHAGDRRGSVRRLQAAAGRGVALIAGGIGITPVRALLEDLPGDVVVVYRVAREEDVILRAELDDALARTCTTWSASTPLSPERLLELVPDLVERDVFVCGPPAMTDAVRATGVPRRQVFTSSGSRSDAARGIGAGADRGGRGPARALRDDATRHPQLRTIPASRRPSPRPRPRLRARSARSARR